MSDRIFALVWLAVCMLITIQMVNLNVPIAYEPVGPKAYPLLLVAVMAVCCMALIIRPDVDVHWPAPSLLRKGALLVGVLLFYAWAFEIVGAPLATGIMALGSAKLFGSRWLTALFTALSVAIFGYLIFDRLLEVSLPLGHIWETGIR